MRKQGVKPKGVDLVTVGKYTVSIGDHLNFHLNVTGGRYKTTFYSTLESALTDLCNKVAVSEATDIKSYIATLQRCVVEIRTAIGSDTAARTINEAVRKMAGKGC